MIHYEVLILRTAPDHVDALSQDYASFGWKRINREEYKRLLTNPNEEEKTPLPESNETVKGNQTNYPGSASFSDWGNANPLSVPSPNDSSTYDGLQNVYFKRDTAMPNLDKIGALKDKYDAIKKEILAQEDSLKHRKEVGHALFTLAILPVVFGFFGIMGGLTCTVLSVVSPEEFGGLKNVAIALWSVGGTLWVIAFVLLGLSFAKGISKKQEKEMTASLKEKIKEKESVLAEARSLRVEGPLPPIQVHFAH